MYYLVNWPVDMISEVLSRAADQSSLGVFITNRDGVIEYVNAAFEAIAGITRKDLLGRTPNIFRSGAHTRRFYEALWSTILGGRTFRAVFKDRRRDGSLFAYDQTITPIRNAVGLITHFISTGRDVSNLRRGEGRRGRKQRNQAVRRLTELHADTGQFLALAHMTLADVTHDADAVVAARLEEVRLYLDQVEERLRSAACDGQRPTVSDIGLIEALTLLADGWRHHGGVEVTIDCSLTSACPAAVETLLYSVVQEAVRFLVRYTGSRKITIELSRQSRHGRTNEAVGCWIRGDGCSTSAPELVASTESPVGLDSIRKRVAAAGGSLGFATDPGDGSVVRAQVPLPA
jgi:PAS domain S-box-containing protein